MDKKTLLCIKSKNSFHHFLKYTLIVFYISILSCVKLLENYMILSWHLDYRCEEWITCIFQNLFQCVCETFLKTLLGCPFGGTCLQPVKNVWVCFSFSIEWTELLRTSLLQYHRKFRSFNFKVYLNGLQAGAPEGASQ